MEYFGVASDADGGFSSRKVWSSCQRYSLEAGSKAERTSSKIAEAFKIARSVEATAAPWKVTRPGPVAKIFKGAHTVEASDSFYKETSACDSF